jgi:hypothetical protein
MSLSYHQGEATITVSGLEGEKGDLAWVAFSCEPESGQLLCGVFTLISRLSVVYKCTFTVFNNFLSNLLHGDKRASDEIAPNNIQH